VTYKNGLKLKKNHKWKNVIWSDELAISIQVERMSKIWIHKDKKQSGSSCKIFIKNPYLGMY